MCLLRLFVFLLLKGSLIKGINFWPVFRLGFDGLNEIHDVRDASETESYLDFLIPFPLSVGSVWVLYITIALVIFVDPMFFLIPFAILGMLALFAGVALSFSCFLIRVRLAALRAPVLQVSFECVVEPSRCEQGQSTLL